MNPVMLTPDDPEPPVGSVVLDCDGVAWQREKHGWRCSEGGPWYGWALTCFGDDWGSTNQPFPPDERDPVYTVLRWGEA